MSSAIERVALSDGFKNWLDFSNRFPERLSVELERGQLLHFNILERDKSGHISGLLKRRGHKGFVLRVEAVDTGIIYAAKLCHAEDYADKGAGYEVKLAADLRPARGLFAAPSFYGKTKIDTLPSSAPELVCFIMEWVEGRSLSDILACSKSQLLPRDACDIALNVFKGISYLKKKSLKHDDLHAGNIMLLKLDESLSLGLDDEKTHDVVIVDTGSLKPIDSETSKDEDDNSHFIEILVELYNYFWIRRDFATQYPRFVNELSLLIGKLCDEDVSRYFPKGDSEISSHILMLKELLDASPLRESDPTFSPFDAISAEHLADDKLLLSLFVSEFPWFDAVKEKTPLALTGPRGCGKSMLFRYLSAKTHILADGGDAEVVERLRDIPFIGVYISCSSDIQNHVLWLRREKDLIERYSQHISTFFQLVILKELFKTLSLIQRNRAVQDFYKIPDSAISDAVRFCSDLLPKEYPTINVGGGKKIDQLIELIERYKWKLSRAMVDRETCAHLLPDASLSSVSDRLLLNAPCLKKTPIVFLLDDYTSHRMPPEIQRITNKIVWERKASQIFKVSSEKFGFDPADVDQLKIDVDREFVFVDAGSYTFSEDAKSKSRKKKFVTSMFNRRLISAEWSGRIEGLIGKSAHANDAALAKHLINNQGAGNDYCYHGIEVLANLWSGDIAGLLHVLREMFIREGVGPETTKMISAKNQHEAIVSVSNSLKERIKGYYPHGPKMSLLLTAYGNAVREILLKGHPKKIKSKSKEDEVFNLVRIEIITKDASQYLDELESRDSQLAEFAKELLRRAIFVELKNSRAKDDVGSETVRWQVRKLLLPAFKTALNKHNYLDYKSLDNLFELLSEPEKECRRIRMRYIKEDVDSDAKQTGDLFAAGGEVK